MSDAPATVRADPMTVLVVSSEADTLRAVDAALSSVGDRCVAAMDAAEAIALAQTAPPGLALVDVALGAGAGAGIGPGVSLVHHLPAVVAGLPVYAMANRPELHHAVEALTAGASGVVPLPVTLEGVLRAVREVRVRRGAAAQRASLERQVAASGQRLERMSRMIRAAARGSQLELAREAADALREASDARGVAVYAAEGAALVRLAFTGEILAPETVTRAELDAASFDRDRERVTMGSGVALLDGADPSRRAAVAAAAQAAGSLLHLVARGGVSPSSGAPSVAPPPMPSVPPSPFPSVRPRASGPPAMRYEPITRFEGTAAREIEKARRHGRKVSIAALVLEGGAAVAEDAFGPALRDGDVVGRDEASGEVLLLLPDTGVLGAQLCRRRIGDGFEGGAVGIATFPHDGSSAEALMHAARRRAELGLRSPVHALALTAMPLERIVATLLGSPLVDAGPRSLYPLDLAFPAAVSLVQHACHEARRGGPAAIVVTSREALGFAAAVREVCAVPGEPVTLREVETRALESAADIVVMASEHGAWVCCGVSADHRFKAVHTSDPLLGDLLARKLVRAESEVRA